MFSNCRHTTLHRISIKVTASRYVNLKHSQDHALMTLDYISMSHLLLNIYQSINHREAAYTKSDQQLTIKMGYVVKTV